MSANSNAIGPDDLSSEFLYMASRSYYQFVIQVTLNNEVGGYLTRREAGKKIGLEITTLALVRDDLGKVKKELRVNVSYCALNVHWIPTTG